jgi:hypothetical protein
MRGHLLTTTNSREIIDPPVVEDPVLSFVIVDGVGKAYTESGAIYDVPVTKVV